MSLRESAALATLIACLLVGCHEYKVNTFLAWCGDDYEAHRPFWAIFYSVKIDRDKIRDDFVKFLNDTYMEKEKRTSRMVWRFGKVLHVVNPSSFFDVEPEGFIADWKKGIAKAQSHTKMDQADNCLWGTVFDLFDSVQIHSLTTDPVQAYWGDFVTALPTDRKKIYARFHLTNQDMNGWYLMVPALVEGPATYPACQPGLVANTKASVAQWSIEGSFDSAEQCEKLRKRSLDAASAAAAEAVGIVGKWPPEARKPLDYSKESRNEWSSRLPLCTIFARGRQVSEAICVSTEDPRLNRK